MELLVEPFKGKTRRNAQYRKGGHHKSRFGEGQYACSTGWPSLLATQTGEDYMGIPAIGKKVGMRVMDWWKREGDLLTENWVFIDILDMLTRQC